MEPQTSHFKVILASISSSDTSLSWVWPIAASIGGIVVFFGLLLEKIAEWKNEGFSPPFFKPFKCLGEWGWVILMIGIALEIGVGFALAWKDEKVERQTANQIAETKTNLTKGDLAQKPLFAVTAFATFRYITNTWESDEWDIAKQRLPYLPPATLMLTPPSVLDFIFLDQEPGARLNDPEEIGIPLNTNVFMCAINFSWSPGSRMAEKDREAWIAKHESLQAIFKWPTNETAATIAGQVKGIELEASFLNNKTEILDGLVEVDFNNGAVHKTFLIPPQFVFSPLGRIQSAPIPVVSRPTDP